MRSCPVSHYVRESEIPEISAWGIHIRNTGKFCLWNPESHALESGIQLGESGIPLTIAIQNPSSIDKELESGIHGAESTIQNGVGFTYMGWPVTTLNNEGTTRTISSKICRRKRVDCTFWRPAILSKHQRKWLRLIVRIIWNYYREVEARRQKGQMERCF